MKAIAFISKLSPNQFPKENPTLVLKIVNKYLKKHLFRFFNFNKFEYLLINQEIIKIPVNLLKNMDRNIRLIKVLNDLLEINNDRIDGYQLATNKSDDVELKNLFSDMTASGFQLCHELENEVQKLEGSPRHSTSNSGKAFAAWAEVRSAILTKDRTAILNSCEIGEDVTLDVYEKTLNNSELLNAALVEKVQLQRMEILRAQTKIKNMKG